MSDNVLYTAGYRGMEASEFAIKLKEAGISLAFDVRRFRSRAPKGLVYGSSMKRTLENQGVNYSFPSAKKYCLGNYSPSLPEYKKALEQDHHKCLVIVWLAEMFRSTNCSICLICAELHAYKDGEPNCHRVHISKALIHELSLLTGEKWEIVHL